MNIIALCGSANTGKTTSIQKAYHKFIDLLEQKNDSSDTGIPADENLSCLMVHIEKSDKRIIFCKDGDWGEVIRDNLEFCKKNQADIAILPTRTRGATIDTLYSCARDEHYRVLRIGSTSNFYGIDQLLSNDAMSDLEADHIVNILCHFLDI